MPGRRPATAFTQTRPGNLYESERIAHLGDHDTGASRYGMAPAQPAPVRQLAGVFYTSPSLCGLEEP